MNHEHYPEYDLTPEEADAYCAGSEKQYVREVIASIIHARGVRDGVFDTRVLDIGCGNGIDAERYPPSHYLGVDGSLALVEAAKRKHPKHDFQCSKAENLPFSNQLFDFVILKAVLEHAHSQGHALDILREATRVGKTIFLAWHTPPHYAEPIIQRMRGHFGRDIYQNVYDAKIFDDFLIFADVSFRKSVVPEANGALYHLWEIRCVRQW